MVLFKYRGKILTQSELAWELGLPITTLYSRIHHHWPMEFIAAAPRSDLSTLKALGDKAECYLPPELVPVIYRSGDPGYEEIYAIRNGFCIRKQSAQTATEQTMSPDDCYTEAELKELWSWSTGEPKHDRLSKLADFACMSYARVEAMVARWETERAAQIAINRGYT